jgi:hypothetical protein
MAAFQAPLSRWTRTADLSEWPPQALSAGRELAGQIQLERVSAAAPAMGVLVAGVPIGEAGVAQGKPRAGRGRTELERNLRGVLTRAAVLPVPRPGETQLAVGDELLEQCLILLRIFSRTIRSRLSAPRVAAMLSIDGC